MSVLSLVPQFVGEHPYLKLELEMQVDGQAIPEACNRVSLQALVSSARDPGKYFIFTCGCGDPGCGGFFKGIEVEHHGETIRWADGDWTYSFEFDFAQYRTEVERALELSIELLDSVADERVDVDGWDIWLFPQWSDATEVVMLDWESEYRRRRGAPSLPGEQAGWRLYVGGCLLSPWLIIGGLLPWRRGENRPPRR